MIRKKGEFFDFTHISKNAYILILYFMTGKKYLLSLLHIILGNIHILGKYAFMHNLLFW